MNILVFGAGGQLGSELVARPYSKDISFQFVRRADAYIDDPAAVRRAMQLARPSLVLNAAAYTDVDQAEIEREAAFRGNAEGPKVLAAACAEKGIPFIHISTDYVFDGRKPSAYVESDATAPINVYGESKLAGEIAVRQACDRHVILRTSWLFGAYRRNFLKSMLKLAAERDEVRVVADQHGCPTATADLADAIVAIAPRLAAGERLFDTYHVASPHPATWYDFAREIIAAAAPYTGRSPKVVPIRTQDYPTRAARPGNSQLDSSKFLSTFGFRAADWRERVRDAVAVLKGRPEDEVGGAPARD
jgi:dTDP-4-dehydrorhamnose reductase